MFQGGFVTKLFSLSPGLRRDTGVCVLTSLFLRGWLSFKDYFSVSGRLKRSETRAHKQR